MAKEEVITEIVQRSIPFSPPDISELEINEVAEALRSGWITTGPRTKELERRLAKYCHTSKTVCLNSATAAEELNLRVCGIEPGDEVIVPAYTYTASASAPIHCGAKVIFVDSQKDNCEMDYDKVAEAITEKTKAVVAVDLGGIICDYDKLYAAIESKKHLFKAKEGNSLWSYDRKTNLFSNYSRGMTACLIPGDPNTIYCARFTTNKESEIWRINFKTGVEEVILAQPGKSYTTPQLSPDGKWLLVTGNSRSEKEGIDNTDIFVVRTDGTQLTQLTYHPGNDLSPVWSPDGKSIFFLSQRGSSDKVYNVWRMNFNL